MTEAEEREFFRREYERAVIATRQLMAAKAASMPTAAAMVTKGAHAHLSRELIETMGSVIAPEVARVVKLQRQQDDRLTQIEQRLASVEQRIAALERAASDNSTTGPPATARGRSLRVV